MVHRRKCPVGKGNGKPQLPNHRKRLRAGDLVDEMRADEQLGLAIPQFADRVCLPDFFEECLSHFAVSTPSTYNESWSTHSFLDRLQPASIKRLDKLSAAMVPCGTKCKQFLMKRNPFESNPSPNQRKSSENPKRARILQAAFSAFQEFGYAGASTLEIATRAKVSKRELYTLFSQQTGDARRFIAERTQRMRLPWNPLPQWTAKQSLPR